MSDGLLAIDQGTTSTRAMVFDRAGRPLARASRELEQHFPRSGWVEHDPEAIWRDCLETARGALEAAPRVAAIGIANQRETTILWDRETGAAVHPAIVWQDRRGAELCRRLEADGCQAMVRARTGLLLDPYFSATKIAWLLESLPGLRERARRGEIAFGTVDSFLLWRLSGGAVHATDVTNASRTLLFNIGECRWDVELLRLFDIPQAILPEVRDCDSDFASVPAALLGKALPITGIAGDQQAAAIGQACFRPGMIKSTYGTGGFMLVNTGAERVDSRHRLLATIAYRLKGETAYALEGSIFAAGAAIQWLRDGLGILDAAEQSEALADAAEHHEGVYLVPAFTGLGAPHWDAEARGAIFGLTRATGRRELARAALEAVAYQSRDLLQAMLADGTPPPAALRVDGGMVANDYLLRFLADMLDCPVERPRIAETTALGAAAIAGLGCGLYTRLDEIADNWALDARFEPAMAPANRARLYAGWCDAVRRVLTKS